MSLVNAGMAKVSVVMCTYNGEGFIEEQILSILTQTYSLKELLIADGCSSGNTEAIVEPCFEI
jgi:glycosyltransferase involved in cell wall biosynthesis